MNSKILDYIFYGLILFLIFKIVSGFSSFFGKSDKDKADEKNRLAADKRAANSEEQIMKKIKPTLNEASAKILADSLERAMAGFGSNEQEVYKVFRSVKNDADFILVNRQFGVRGIGKETLTQWINGDLSVKEVGWLNDILKKNKVSFRF